MLVLICPMRGNGLLFPFLKQINFFGSLVPFAAPSVFFAFVRWSFSRLPRSPISTAHKTNGYAY